MAGVGGIYVAYLLPAFIEVWCASTTLRFLLDGKVGCSATKNGYCVLNLLVVEAFFICQNDNLPKGDLWVESNFHQSSQLSLRRSITFTFVCGHQADIR